MDINIGSTDLATVIGISRQALYAHLQKHGHDKGTGGKQAMRISPTVARSLLEDRGFRFPKRAIAFQIVKGGVGKTSLAKLFGLRAASLGYKVLFADFDHQANLTDSLGAYSSEHRTWLDFVTATDPDPKDFVLTINDSIGLMPAGIQDADVLMELQRGTKNLAGIFHSAFQTLHTDFDLIVADCPPALGPHVTAVFLAVDTIVAPVNPDKFSYDGLKKMVSTWKGLAKSFNRNVAVKILVNRYDGRIRSHQEMVSELFAAYPDLMSPVIIKASADIQNAISNPNCQFFGSRSSAAEDLDSFVRSELGLSDFGGANA